MVEPQASPRSHRVRAWVRAQLTGWAVFPVVAFLASRGTYVLYSWLGLRIEGAIHQGDRDPFFLANPALDGLCRWDCGWYKLIAISGYDRADLHTANIWPGFPMLSRGLSWVLGLDVHYTMLIVANLGGLGALVAVYKVFLSISEEEAARGSLMLFVAFPFHFFQAAAYPESLMVFTSSLAILLALRGNHLWAGLVLGAGSVTRHLTLTFGGGLLAAQIQQRGVAPRKLLTVSLVGLVIPFAFPAAFMLFQHYRFGDALAFWHSRDLWGESAWMSISQAVRTGVPDFRHRIYLVGFVALVCSAIACLTRRSWVVLGVAVLPLLLVIGASGIEGLGRYSAAAWPAFFPVGVWLARRPRLQLPIVGCLFLLQGLFFFLFTHQYPIL